MAHERRASAPLPPALPAGVPPHRRLWQLRRERQLSMAELAKLAGVRPATICELERGTTRMPQPRTLAKLAMVFGMSLDDFRRALGMHGPASWPGALQRDGLDDHQGLSPRARKIAGLVETLPADEQALIETLAMYFHLRRSANLPANGTEVGQ